MPEVWRDYDAVQRGTLDPLVPGLDVDGYVQAGLSGGVGCLGFWHIEKVALPAPIGLRIMAGPKVAHLARELNTAGLVTLSRFMVRYDSITDVAVAAFASSLDELERRKGRDLTQKTLIFTEAALASAVAT